MSDIKDPVEIMRKVANGDEVTGNAMRKEVGGTDWSDALLILADMVERNYVRRDDYDFTVEMLNCMKAERDELKARISELEKQWDARDSDCIALEAKVNRLEDEIANWSELHAQVLSERNHVIAERDEWKTKCETREFAYKQADAERKRYSEQIDELTAERDEWKAKAEQAQESYLDAKESRDKLMGELWACCECEMSKYYPDCDLDENGTRREWLMAPHEDANDVFSGESVVTPEAVDANDSLMDLDSCTHGMRTFASETDSREKLEAYVLEIARKINMTEDGIQACSKELNALLDRQAAITEREWEIEQAYINSGYNERIAELQDQLESANAKNRALKAHISKMQEGRHGWHVKAGELQKKVDALTQANGDLRDEWHRVCHERDELRRELTMSNRERESLRKQLGIALDHAHDMIALVNVDTDEGAE